MESFVIEAGAVAAGTIALATALGLVVGAIAKDLGADVSQWEWAGRGSALGALIGVVWVISNHIPWN
jgi:hypothetical protein